MLKFLLKSEKKQKKIYKMSLIKNFFFLFPFPFFYRFIIVEFLYSADDAMKYLKREEKDRQVGIFRKQKSFQI